MKKENDDVTWEFIRSNWVNGNLTEAKGNFINQPKLYMISLIHEALENHYEYLTPTSHSGDLRDLFEILSSILRDNK